MYEDPSGNTGGLIEAAVHPGYDASSCASSGGCGRPEQLEELLDVLPAGCMRIRCLAIGSCTSPTSPPGLPGTNSTGNSRGELVWQVILGEGFYAEKNGTAIAQGL